MDPIIIIGSGLGGLALAQGLHKSSIPFKIYERDQLRNVRTQGYRIRLHGEGLCALRSVLIDEVWDLFEETCPETRLGPLPNINAVTCEVTAANFGGNNPQGRISQSNQKPHTADRAIMREVLLTGLDKHITYGKEYTHYGITDSGIIAHFADGASEPGSLLVGADGVRSAVRRQYLPHLRVLDTKSRPMYGKTPLTRSFQSHTLPKAMECLSLIKDPQTGSVTLMEVIRFLPKDQRKDKRDLPNDYVYWVIIPPGSSSLITDERLNHISKEGPAELAKALTAHWHPSLRLLIEDQDPNQTGVFRLLSSDPESLKRGWEPNAKVTLLGDAAHAMMPSTASGAVTALRDAELLSSLIREQGVAKEIIAKYEEEMRNYASEAVALSARIGQMSFGVKALADSEAVSA
jgi:2-polyprenyl-6-methoxyphenol hydroxylase-like FAD-dependent oxidoreductase